MSLVLEQDASRVSYEQVINAPAPMYRSPTYQPVSNKELLDMLEKVATGFGLTLKNPQFGLARKGQRMFGVYEVEGQKCLSGKVNLMLGIRNSGDRQLSAGICFGSKVFVCSNLCFTGYAGEDGVVGRVSHKHTINVMETLHERLCNALSQFEKYRNFQNKFYRGLKKTSISDNDAFAIIVKAVMADAIPNKDVVHMAHSWLDSGKKDGEGTDGWYPDFIDRNAWSLFNNFTHRHKIYQERNPVVANQRSIALTTMFRHLFN